VEFGVSLIAFGGIFLAAQMGYLSFDWKLSEFFSAAMVILGTIRLLFGGSFSRSLSGLFQIFVGVAVYAMFEHLWDLDFYTHWPLLLIGLGIIHLIKSLVEKWEDKSQEKQ
jgi:hypothetical protein